MLPTIKRNCRNYIVYYSKWSRRLKYINQFTTSITTIIVPSILTTFNVLNFGIWYSNVFIWFNSILLLVQTTFNLSNKSKKYSDISKQFEHILKNASYDNIKYTEEQYIALITKLNLKETITNSINTSTPYEEYILERNKLIY